jgi:formylglycine-generating enzyme required for sulfatase activity
MERPLLLVLMMKTLAICCILLVPGFCIAQTQAWPQQSRWLDSNIWFSDDRLTTHSLVIIGTDSGCSFGMLEHEVCNKQWLEFLDDTGHLPPISDFDMEDSHAYHQRHAWHGRVYPPGGGGLPIVFISIEEAEEFCHWLTNKSGYIHRLPTNEEWTLAAGPFKYPWGESLNRLRSVPVGRSFESGTEPFYAATDDITPDGLKFMLGNVREFVSTKEGNLVVLRGSGFHSSPSTSSLQKKTKAVEGLRSYDVGFRYVVPLDHIGNPIPVNDQPLKAQETLRGK